MDQMNRPKIHIAKTKLEWLADSVGYVALVFMFGYLIFSWSSLPAEVPAHFDIKGEVDRWGSKYGLLIVPFIALFLHLFLNILEKKPHLHSYSRPVNENNVRDLYTNSRQLLNYLKNITTLLFVYGVWNTIYIAKGAEASLGWPFFFLLALLFIVLIWKTIKSFKIK